MAIGTCPLSWSLSGVKQTLFVAAHMSAFDPKRTSVPPPDRPLPSTDANCYHCVSEFRGKQ